MIKKIILLVLSFSFSVTSVVYGTVTKADPVTSGTGTGTSVKIEDTSALSTVMSQIPSYDDYTGEQTIRELYPDFKPFTMIETGYGEKAKEETVSREVVEDDQKKYLPFVRRTTELTNHSLSISFTEDAVYYHTVGSRITTNIYYEYETITPSGENSSYNYTYYSFDREQDFVDAERTVINFDAEIYHSKDATMIKYNKYETINEVSDLLSVYGDPMFKAAEEEELVDEDEILQKEMKEKVEKIREDNYGVWLKLETYTEEELATKFGDLMNPEAPPTEENYEQYKDLMIDYMIYETCNLVSEAEAESFAKANASNCTYLGILSNFIKSDNEDVSFEKNGNEYKLINYKRVQTTDPNTNESLYVDKPVGKDAYISSIFGSWYTNEKNYYTNVYFSYVVGSDVAVVDQNADWSTKDSSANRHLDESFKMDTVTNFLGLDNTVAAIEKGAKVKTITEAYSGGLREIYSDYIDRMMSGEEN